MMSYKVDWHPIKSRADLPKGKYVICLVTWPDKHVSEIGYEGLFQPRGTWETEEKSFRWDDEDAPIAWAPMPEPWRGE